MPTRVSSGCVFWLLLVGCPPKVTAPEEAAVEVVEAPEPVETVVPVLLPALNVPDLPADPVGQLDPNLWRTHYNDALAAAKADDPERALELALKAVANAPSDHRAEAIELLAVQAEVAGEVGWEFAALDALLELDEGEWTVFWNGFVDARTEREDERALRYAEEAVARCPEPEELLPKLAWAALDAGALDRAAEVAQDLDPDHPVRADVVQALVLANRCELAKALDETAC